MSISKNIFTVFVLFVSSLTGFAQELANFADDACVSRGILPDGINYIIVSDSSSKGKAEVSLLQRICQNDTIPDISLQNKMLGAKGMLHGRSFEEVLLGNGVIPGPEGFVKALPGAALVRLRDIQFSRDSEVIDSVLYGMMKLVEQSVRTDDRKYGTDNQTIIVTGDVDKASVEGKLKMYSILIPKHAARAVKDPEYVRTDRDIKCRIEHDPMMNTARLRFCYDIERTSLQNTKTLIPIVTKHLVENLGIVASRRIEKAFRNDNLAICDIDYRYKSCADSPGDEQFILEMTVPGDDVLQAVTLVSEVLGTIDMLGVSHGEIIRANRISYLKALDRMNRPISGEEWMDRCIGSVLYGTDLAKDRDKLSAFSGKQIEDTTQTRLFNNFASSLLDNEKHVSIICRTGFRNASEEDIMDAFRSSWMPQSVNMASSQAARDAAAKSLNKIYGLSISDTLRFPDKSAKKTTLKKASPEAASGSTMWTFSNGMRVIYRNTPTNGMMYFSFILNSGRSSLKSGRNGEAAFLPDVLGTYTINEQQAMDFAGTMQANGILMGCDASYSNLTISGMATSNKLQTLMKALASVTTTARADEKEFAYYKDCEELRLLASEGSIESRFAEIDSKVSSGFEFGGQRQPGCLTEAFLGRADDFYKTVFSRPNDGAIIIICDKNEENALKEILPYMGNFEGEKTIAPRSPVNYHITGGELSLTGKGPDKSALEAMICEFQLSAENVMAIKVTEEYLRNLVYSRLADTGLAAHIDTKFQFAPRETLTYLISFSCIEGMEDKADMGTAKRIMSEVLEEAASKGPSDSMLKYCKAAVKDSIDSDSAFPYYWLDVAGRRFADGKDFNTKYADKINAITADKVKNVLNFVNRGARVFYTTDN